ncbi:MAG: hypothetical protein Q8R88_10185 [Desulfoprunum sp.]|nr:hypothetical protein [Desulfoprunum sp.]
MQEISVCHVQLNNLEAGDKRSPRCRSELLFDLIYLSVGHGFRDEMTYIKRNGAWRQRLPSTLINSQWSAAEPWG